MTQSTFRTSDSVCGTSELNRFETDRQRIRVLMSETALNIRRIRESGRRPKPSISNVVIQSTSALVILSDNS
uniref:Uncharacterized protein n=1 Tax=Rhizophora mucronata TaxID=61149 RepID=A0A2P2Q5P5_RHIMU